MRILLLFIYSIIFFSFLSRPINVYPKNLEAVLKKAGKNRNELEKAIIHFQKSGNPLKLKAIYFLIYNMDIHYSQDYFWADSISGKRVVFNELDYPDMVSAIEAFDKIKLKTGKLKPIPFTYKDIDTITSSYLIENVDRAFETWKKPIAKMLSFEDFCEYILPYRVSTEPLQNWRDAYEKKFSWISDSAKVNSIDQNLLHIASDFKTWFTNTWDIEVRKEPLPRLGPLQLLSRKRGNCDDIGDLEVYTLRSQGYPASLEHIPFWATTTGRHYFNSTYDENMKLVPFDISTPEVKINNFSREPSKVIRITYAKQAGVLAGILPESNIPPGFLRTQNYKDVTSSYWKTADISIPLFRVLQYPPVAYACVFNGFSWKPTWWGKVKEQNVIFNNMCRGAVFLPMYYINSKLVVAGYPIASGYTHQQVLKPDTLNKRSLTIKQQEKYLIFRPSKVYKLYYWNNGWKLSDSQKSVEGSTELVFASVPKNALYLLIPEYSQGKERPFIVTDEGERIWY